MDTTIIIPVLYCTLLYCTRSHENYSKYPAIKKSETHVLFHLVNCRSIKFFRTWRIRTFILGNSFPPKSCCCGNIAESGSRSWSMQISPLPHRRIQIGQRLDRRWTIRQNGIHDLKKSFVPRPAQGQDTLGLAPICSFCVRLTMGDCCRPRFR
jgi:hypothetical protein